MNNISTEKMLKAYLVHLSYNFWVDNSKQALPGGNPKQAPHIHAAPVLRFSLPFFRRLVERLAQNGFHMLVLDLGDGIRYKCCKSIAVENALSRRILKRELAFARSFGLEVIPKLNFSSGHDVWLGEYARCLSTPRYYKVCADLIAESAELFDGPRLIHLGMDEEDPVNQASYEYLVVRQHDLWWHDLFFFFEQVRQAGARPWIWADSIWKHEKIFLKQMPGDVMLSNYYYGDSFDPESEWLRKYPVSAEYIKAYLTLSKYAYDQIPTASNYFTPENFHATRDFCLNNIDRKHLHGFMQTTWMPTLEDFEAEHFNAIQACAEKG